MKKRIITAISLCLTGILVWFIGTGFRTPKIRHVVLISIDTFRADHLSCYGYSKKTTPNIDALVEQATRFETVVCPVPITLPAHCSMLTGKTPPSHGVHHNFGYKLADSNQTLAELLKKNGFGTAAIISTFVLHSQFGINQGFDTYYDNFSKHHQNEYGVERGGDETTRLALDWIDGNRDEKAFLFLHYYDPHYDYVPPEPYATQFADNPYAGEIAFTDHCIGRVIQKLKDLDLYDSTLLIITGDHGEMLGEHGEATHTYFIYESAIKVPLIVKLPGQKEGITVSDPVGLIDIVPTICSLLKIDPPADIQGVDLSAFLLGENPDIDERYLYSESVSPTRFGASSLMGISTARWKYIQAPRPELYDVMSDPGETNNLVKKEHQRARILEDKLQEILEQSVRKDSDSQMELDSESIKRLESLGYVAGKEEGEIVFDKTKGDPKDFVHLIEVIRDIRSITERGEFRKARSMLEEIAQQAPQCPEIFAKLGEIEMLQQDYAFAVESYRRVYQLDPEAIPPDVYNDLAWIQATRPSLPSRDVDEALEYAKRNCEQTKYNEPNALDTLATAYAATGDFHQAVKTAEEALRLAGNMKNFELEAKIKSRLDLFEQSKPYIEE
ncbi:MAG: sulfatase-like hydrolase/transferase [Kiritimatiellaeota bacterium]|nr:sulfatase-like hydrolase/transferase [Kiritimatiellota bacterium]